MVLAVPFTPLSLAVDHARVGGARIPLQAVSRARTGSSSVDDVEKHCEFDLAAHALRFIARVRPAAALCENVVGFKPWIEGFCQRLEAEGYHVETRKLPLNTWTDAASTRFYIFALDVRRAPRTSLTRALEVVDALQAARGATTSCPDTGCIAGAWAMALGAACPAVGRAYCRRCSSARWLGERTN